MKDRNLASPGFENKCLSIEDFYRYIALPQGDNLPDLTPHLAHCPKCQEELAEILRLLNPGSEEQKDDDCNLSDQEITKTLNLIQGVARKEEANKHRSRWLHWAAAAAAAIGLLGTGAGALKFYQNRVSNQYFEQARASLEELRLDYEDFLRQRGLPLWQHNHPALMRFTLKLLANLTDPSDGDAMDRVINALTKVAPAA